MGSGLVDFSAYEKVQLRWLSEVEQVFRPGSYRLGRPDVLRETPYALVIKTGTGEYWIEQRLDVGQPGLAVRTVEPDVADDDLAPSTLFLNGPIAAGRATVARGETFRVPGVFALRYAETLRFTWLDRTRPAAPRVTVRAGRVSWLARDSGSGIASCSAAVDGRRFAGGAAQGTVTLPNLTRGSHRVSVACVDRAGNRSRATIKRVRLGT